LTNRVHTLQEYNTQLTCKLDSLNEELSNKNSNIEDLNTK